jgi:serine O-acetyltransferase
VNPAVGLYRLGHFFHSHGLQRLAWAISWCNRLLFATWIPSSARIGRNFACGYWGLGVVIHKDTVIGDDCVVSQNVTIGRNPDDTRVPVIGNRVHIYPGAVVAGEIHVGDDAVIGANSVVLSDVPARALMVGAPARVVRLLPTSRAVVSAAE